MSSSRDRMLRLRYLRRRHLVAKLIDVNLLALAEKFDIPDERLNDDRELRGVGT